MTDLAVVTQAFAELRQMTPARGHGILDTLEQAMIADGEALDAYHTAYVELTSVVVSNVVPIRQPQLVGDVA